MVCVRCSLPFFLPLVDLLLLRVGAGMFQVVVLGMTLSRQLSTKHTGWARTPLSSLMMKDSLFVFFLLFGVYPLHVPVSPRID